MIYVKTSIGRSALAQRDLLSLRERQLMVLCNGVRGVDELTDLMGVTAMDDLARLERKGYLSPHWQDTQGMPLEALLASHPDIAAAGAAIPPPAFVASQLSTQPPPPELAELRSMSLSELTALADVAPVNVVTEPPALPEMQSRAPAPAPVAELVNSISSEHEHTHSTLAAQAYMTQVLVALDSPAALELVETHGDVRHEVDVLLYLAQGIGLTYAATGEDVALRVAMRVVRLLPEPSVAMLLDCVLEYVPHEFSVLLYEFVLAGRDTPR